jgi:uncharacterized protein (TIGR02646 family)
MARFVRSKTSPPQFSNYRRYRPYLRADFHKRCAYCEMTERVVLEITAFGIDHFRPKKLFPDLECRYENLYYCCNDCNRYKGWVWPSADRSSEGYFFPDPCECDPQIDHLSENDQGRLVPITNAGVFALEVLRLNRESCTRFRTRRRLTRERIVECRIQLESAIAPPEVRTLLAKVLGDLEVEWSECYGIAALTS